MSVGDNRLAMLADDIRTLARSIERNVEKTARDAIEAGRRLIEAKGLLKHGQWGSWLRENCDLNPRTARLYMQLARAGLENGNVAILGVRRALGMITRADRRSVEAARQIIRAILTKRSISEARALLELVEISDLIEALDAAEASLHRSAARA